MSDDKIKIKDLAVELNVSAKDLMQALRGLEISAKSSQSNVDVEDLPRIRAHFAAAAQTEVVRREIQPGVIVRRRKDKKEEAAPEVSQEKAAPVATSEEAVASKDAAASAPKDNEVKEPKTAKESKKAKESEDARIIRRGGEQEEAAEAGAEEAQAVAVEPEPKEEAPAAKPRRAASKSVAQDKESEETGSPAEEAPASKKEGGTSLRKLAAPDATAEPDAEDIAASRSGVAAGLDAARHGRPAKPAGHGEAENASGPQVRVISRPERLATPVAPAAPAVPQYGEAPDPALRERGYSSSDAGAAAGYRGRTQDQDRDGAKKKGKQTHQRRTVDFHQELDENVYSGLGAGGEADLWSESAPSGPRPQRRPRRRGKEVKLPTATQPLKAIKRKIRMDEFIRVGDLAHEMGLKSTNIIKVLMNLGILATVNQALDVDTATLVAAEFDYEVEAVGFSEEEYLKDKVEDAPENLKPRPPVVTIMGHVDHGKTSLLDAIRKSSVAAGEAGGITQHIGAYHVTTKRGDIVFLDTPGHEAFTAMRARGAQVTDLVILVVAADDGVMEQTREAANHAKAAGVPLMVAVNKIDKPGADPERAIRELSEIGLVAEEWGGETVFAKVSAKTGQGLDDLLDMILLQSEMMELKANPDKPARGRIVEARLDKGRGPMATVLIQEGTLRTGDPFVCGVFSGRVRAMFDDQGHTVKDAGPAIPVEVQGFEGVPEAGEEFFAVEDEKVGRRIADDRAAKQRERELVRETKVTLETFLASKPEDQEAISLNLLVKADVQGSLEAITEALNKQSTDKVRITVIHGGAGAITESDVMLASASAAIIIGFNVRPTAKVRNFAEQEKVDIRFYDIIYKLVDDVRNAMAGLLAPVVREEYLGQAEVRQVFVVPKVGAIAGSFVVDGKITRNAGIRILRDGVVIHTGKISSLKRFKDDMREVLKGYECGVGIDNFNDVKEGDVFEAFENVEEAATL